MHILRRIEPRTIQKDQEAIKNQVVQKRNQADLGSFGSPCSGSQIKHCLLCCFVHPVRWCLPPTHKMWYVVCASLPSGFRHCLMNTKAIDSDKEEAMQTKHQCSPSLKATKEMPVWKLFQGTFCQLWLKIPDSVVNCNSHSFQLKCQSIPSCLHGSNNKPNMSPTNLHAFASSELGWPMMLKERVGNMVQYPISDLCRFPSYKSDCQKRLLRKDWLEGPPEQLVKMPFVFQWPEWILVVFVMEIFNFLWICCDFNNLALWTFCTLVCK